MKKLILVAALVLTGCKSTPPTTTQVPLPPIPNESNTPGFKVTRQSVRALEAPVTQPKYIVLKWDMNPSDEEVIVYRVRWKQLPGLQEMTAWKFFTQLNKVDVVPYLKQAGTPSGWYLLEVEAVGQFGLPSSPTPACYLFWHPLSDQ